MGSSLVQSQHPSHLRTQLGARQSIGCWAAHLACHRVERSSYGKTTETTIETIGTPPINTPYVVVKYTRHQGILYSRWTNFAHAEIHSFGDTEPPFFCKLNFKNRFEPWGCQFQAECTSKYRRAHSRDAIQVITFSSNPKDGQDDPEKWDNSEVSYSGII